jgi:phospholipase C
MHILNNERLTAFVLTLAVILLILLDKSPLLSVVSATAAVTTVATTSTTNPPTATPIKHLVVIYQENVAFDHYFATYPKAANPDGEPRFLSSPNTPSINGLTTAGLLTNNTNLANPFRLDRSQATLISLCNPDHDYTALQKSFNGGLMDKFVENSVTVTEKL